MLRPTAATQSTSSTAWSVWLETRFISRHPQKPFPTKIKLAENLPIFVRVKKIAVLCEGMVSQTALPALMSTQMASNNLISSSTQNCPAKVLKVDGFINEATHMCWNSQVLTATNQFLLYRQDRTSGKIVALLFLGAQRAKCASFGQFPNWGSQNFEVETRWKQLESHGSQAQNSQKGKLLLEETPKTSQNDCSRITERTSPAHWPELPGTIWQYFGGFTLLSEIKLVQIKRQKIQIQPYNGVCFTACIDTKFANGPINRLLGVLTT